ncbi:hypothetical protein BRD56_05360 [Thermoplasmatales archaeon SW_10_69_26]|nr:MAG: hypothetical protein BRD56_05360 [Thermoplasmatales archaeon SW_10_69_26]
MTPDTVTHEDLLIEDNADWSEPRTVTQEDCAACGTTHEIRYYPIEDAPVPVGEKTINGRTGECYLLAAGPCPEADRLVHVYATRDGWDCPPECSIDHVQDGPDP